MKRAPSRSADPDQLREDQEELERVDRADDQSSSPYFRS